VVAEHDHVEGTLRSSQGVLVLGSFAGRIESETWIRMGERSTVKADVTAEEVVVAGQYEGKLVARGRLEIAATGHIQGDIEAPRLMLHEGGFIDGALYMTRTEGGRPGASGSSGSGKPASVRESGGEASARRGVGPGVPAGSPAGTSTKPSYAKEPSDTAGTGSAVAGADAGPGADGTTASEVASKA
jgi:cytoskeletal protein CcmA (bactofilin family)